MLASSGTLSTSFYIVNLFLNCHPALTSNLSPPCLPICFPTKYSNFIRLSSRILPILHFIFNHVTFLLISQSSSLFLEKNSLNSDLTFCDLDPIPTSILKQCLPILLPTITDIITSLSPLVFFLNSSNSSQSFLF